VTVTAPTVAELRQRRDGVTGADLVELRLDTVADPSAAGALAGRRQPVIVTCRPIWEGGQFKGSEEERRRLLGEALSLGAEYVDIEWQAHFDDLLARTGGRRIVLSFHDFASMPADVSERARAMRATGAAVIKIAAQARRLSDCVPLLDLGAALKGDRRAVLIAMGEAGLASRILAGRFGSAWTYAGTIGQVGQLSASELLDDYHFRSIGGATEVFGLFGSPIAHSVSPAMHNAAFRAAGVDAVYLPLPAADVDDCVTFARAVGLKGASVTIPFKVSLLDRVREADDVARRVGALNTIRITEGTWLGANTDAAGFLQPLQEIGVALDGTRAAVLGAGGSARAVAVALASCGADVTVHGRNRQRAADVAMLASGRAGDWPPSPGSWDLLVNCTPIGMYPRIDQTPVPAASLTGRVVYDLVYNPAVTRLLREAATAGCQTIGGLGMLVGQAHEQFRWWTNTRPPPGIMRAAALSRLAEFSTNENHVV
jgi:3-dehydroquinate dehydratase/shikimate dehydrogenase